jgi:hypothetical protein
LVFSGFSMMIFSARQQSQEALRHRHGGHSGGDAPVCRAERDLDAPAHGCAVDEGEGRHRERAELLKGGVSELADRPCLLPGGHRGDAGEIGADGEDERLAGHPDPDDLTCLSSGPQGAEHLCEAGQGGRAEGVRLGVVEAVVQGDQHERAGAAGQGDVARDGPGDDLVREEGGEVDGRHQATVPFASASCLP